MTKRTFTFEEAAAVLPQVQQLTNAAVERIDAMSSDEPSDYEGVVAAWAEAVLALGVEVKGLWLVDFDSGAGYYCWRHPEPGLEYFHGYDEGFGGRVKLN